MRIIAIAKNTFKEALRGKMFNIMLIFALVTIGSTKMFSFFTPREEMKMIKDMGFFFITIFGLLIAIILGARLIYEELEKKTIYTVLSKPVRKYELILGKLFGAMFTLLINLCFMTAVFLVVLYLKERALNFEIFKAMFLIFISLSLLSSIAIMFSTFSTMWISITLTLFIYIVGNIFEYLKHLAQKGGIVLKFVLEGAYYLFPNFTNFNINRDVVHGTAVSGLHILKVTVYGLNYIIIFTLLSILFFRKREV
ncbi:ABC transporter permease subunit [bacterium]|nr:ABC transporter permease subunit [bacterium]